MLKVTTWSPDTCGCVLEYEWDDAVPEASRTHTVKQVKVACPHHRDMPLAKHFDTVLGENRMKNRAVGVVHEALLIEKPELYRGLNTEEDKIPVTARLVEWGFDVERKIHIKLQAVSLNPGAQAAIQFRIDQALGTGKVKVG